MFALLLCLPNAAFADEQKTYLVLGDSISTGYQPGGTHLTDQAFFGIVAKDRGHTLDNHAITGNTSTGVWGQMQNGALDADIKQASVITLTIGGNDMMAPLYASIAAHYNETHTSAPIEASDITTIFSNSKDPRYGDVLGAATFVISQLDQDTDAELTVYMQPTINALSSNLDSIASYIHALNPDATFVVETQYYPYYWLKGSIIGVLINEGFGTEAAAFPRAIPMLNNEIVANATGSDGTVRYVVADSYAAFAQAYKTSPSTRLTCAYYESTDDSSLDFHPNVAGHALIAKTMEGVMLPQMTVSEKPAAGLAYTGAAQALGSVNVTVPASGAVVRYGTSADTCDSTATPTQTAAGTYTTYYKVTASGYEVCKGSFAATIVAADASGATVSGIDSSYIYTGAAITPAPTVTLNGTTLTAGTDYTVSYADNTDPGTATYTITSIGNYTGMKSGTFTIAKKHTAELDAPDGITQTGLDQVLAALSAAQPEAKSIDAQLIIVDADLTDADSKAIASAFTAAGLTPGALYNAFLGKVVDGTLTDIGSSNDVLVGVSYPFDFSGKDQMRVFTYHAEQTYELTTAPNAYGEYIVLDRNADTVTVFAKRYSTFGIGYTVAAATPSTAETSSANGVPSSATPSTADETMPCALGMLALALAGAGCAAFARRHTRA
jgi:lysophospholipase L1-like esterase